MTPAVAAGEPKREQIALVNSHPVPPPEDVAVKFQGRVADKTAYSIVLRHQKQKKRMLLRASLNGVSLGTLKVALDTYREIDAIPSLGVNEEDIELIFRFGNYRTQCYVNDDGRDRLTIRFSKGKGPTANVNSFEGCENDL